MFWKMSAFLKNDAHGESATKKNWNETGGDTNSKLDHILRARLLPETKVERKINKPG